MRSIAANCKGHCMKAISCSFCLRPATQPSEQTARAIAEEKQEVSFSQNNPIVKLGGEEE